METTPSEQPHKKSIKPPLPHRKIFESQQMIIKRMDSQDSTTGYRDNSINSIPEHSLSSGQQYLILFQKYKPESEFDIQKLKSSQLLKLKRYKECVYFGEIVNQMRHGNGIMLYNNNRVYQGQWQTNLKFGKGYQKFANGSKYIGNYVNGKPEGYGTFVWTNGQIYEGQWANGLKHGSGMWKGIRGDSYIGEWKQGIADGYGVHTWINGDRYEGQFQACLKHGEGSEKFSNGDTYVGGYVNGKPSGYGQYTWLNRSFYKGHFKNGLRHGNGVWKKGTGVTDKYQGQYANDKKCGYGIFTWSNGNVYKGQYFNDLRDGYGQIYWNDGSFYKGKWSKGVQHGEGEIKFANQQSKKGIFEENVLVNVIQQETQQTNIKIKPKLQIKHFNTTGSLQKQSNSSYYSKKLNNTYAIENHPIQNSNLERISETTLTRKFKTINNIRPRQLQSIKNTTSNCIQNKKIFASSKNKIIPIQSRSVQRNRPKINSSVQCLQQYTSNKRPSLKFQTQNNKSMNRQIYDLSMATTKYNRVQTGLNRKDIQEQIINFTRERLNSKPYIRLPLK